MTSMRSASDPGRAAAWFFAGGVVPCDDDNAFAHPNCAPVQALPGFDSAIHITTNANVR